ncbi:hypothetical protein C817_03423 [Dorea sp. 5-2]|nr:hypothetical protein C817_03423 [Dorea sp. 5-2]
MMRVLKRILAGVCMAALLAVMPASTELKAEELRAEDLKSVPGKVEITSEEKTVITFQPGEMRVWSFTIHNNTGVDLENVVIIPKLADPDAGWPFKEESQSFERNIGTIKNGESIPVEYQFTQREDAPAAGHTIQFDVYANDENNNSVQVALQNFYVNTTAKPEEAPPPAPDDNNSLPPDDSADLPGGDLISADAGGFSNGGVVSGGGSGERSTSVPRVIVTGFSTDPAEVRAGSNFVLTVHLKNTSKSTRVKNMLFDLNAPSEGSDEQTVSPAFLPSSGSSSIYLDGIKADGSADISIQLNAKADLLQKPYSVDLSMKYEDAEGSQIETASSLSIPVKQDARFEFSEFEISPDSISVGDEANVMCSLYNLGRIKLYNVKATFEGACIKKEEVFVGNVDSGASASIDAMLEGAQATEGPAKVTMTVSYEDEAGRVATSQKELQIEVMEAMENDMMAGGMEIIEEEKGFPVLPVAVIGAVVLIIVVVVVVRKKRKKKQRLNEEEELLNELDGPSEDER